MVTLSLTLEDTGLEAGLTDALRQLSDLTPLMRRIGGVLETSVSERFEQSKGPGGVPWAPSQRAREVGGKTLVDSTRLRDSIVSEAGPRSVEVGSNVPYAAIHQSGGTIKPRDADKLAFRLPNGQFVMVDQVTIPARPFLGFDAADEAEIAQEVAAWLAEAFS
ncbi:phage virion morphogenesis (putative tail completion) protein [Roseovarius azorensis]|uniref:Phage virion morphogenesis (Putative tail completion) protein n=1 Tax=Roseovarius azorensis TaxID=1287727 RepID=A0A1H7G8G7_9RHOB|nr:phage virion morphogenesis protein [Roseovarius azorensis]SEK34431.1 phage virion morphogenesis (putative tail completion) protein [Roseovarius azorensis]